MTTTPLPPMTPAMMSKYWAACNGVRAGRPYHVGVNDPGATIKRGAFTGVFTGVTPSGDLVFTGKETGTKFYLSPKVNATLKRAL